jgi:hypothetical protein
VNAVILPHRYIVVDAKGNILEIDSNTSQDVLPEVFLGTIAVGHKQSLDDTLYKQYQQILAARPGPHGVGVLYKQPANRVSIVSKLVYASARIDLATR